MTETLAEIPVLAWHFVASDHRLQYGDGRIVRPGETLSVEGELELCEFGLHASRRAIDALGYTNNNALTVCRVECWGGVIEGTDKLVAHHRKVLWMYDASKVLHQFAVDAAREALNLYGGDHPATALHHKLLDLKQQWINGEITDAEWAAAWAAAWDAAWAAARDAAWAATRDATRDAAWDAAWAATRAAARAATRDATLSRLNARLESMLTVGAREFMEEVLR